MSTAAQRTKQKMLNTKYQMETDFCDPLRNTKEGKMSLLRLRFGLHCFCNENSNAKETFIDTKIDVDISRSSSTESKFSLETPWGILDATHPALESLSEVPSKELFKVRLSRVKLTSLPAIDERLKKDAKEEDQIHDSGEATLSTGDATIQTTKKLGFFGRLRRCFRCLVTDRRQRRKQTQADDEFSTFSDLRIA